MKHFLSAFVVTTMLIVTPVTSLVASRPHLRAVNSQHRHKVRAGHVGAGQRIAGQQYQQPYGGFTSCRAYRGAAWGTPDTAAGKVVKLRFQGRIGSSSSDGGRTSHQGSADLQHALLNSTKHVSASRDELIVEKLLTAANCLHAG